MPRGKRAVQRRHITWLQDHMVLNCISYYTSRLYFYSIFAARGCFFLQRAKHQAGFFKLWIQLSWVFNIALRYAVITAFSGFPLQISSLTPRKMMFTTKWLSHHPPSTVYFMESLTLFSCNILFPSQLYFTAQDDYMQTCQLALQIIPCAKNQSYRSMQGLNIPLKWFITFILFYVILWVLFFYLMRVMLFVPHQT